ncbi:hypothetical protein [Streptomyces synnematoformans]|uniref:Uncharacterized protein n=1 Tax=Streptomyces synnematoformans TaxID=415721 RepID=A0ABN2YII3_9ACTN
MKATRTALDTALSEMADSPTHLRAWRNRLTLTDHGVQLRLGPDARWYPYLQDDGEWWPAAPADSDPVTALTAAWSQNRE